MTQTLDQERAANALARARQIAGESQELQRSYRAYVDRLGPSILSMGLGQALATERAAAGPKPDKNDKKAHAKLYQSIEEWLCRKEGVYAGAQDLLEALSQGSEDQYLLAQVEALAWLQWHKKFCRAELEGTGRND